MWTCSRQVKYAPTQCLTRCNSLTINIYSNSELKMFGGLIFLKIIKLRECSAKVVKSALSKWSQGNGPQSTIKLWMLNLTMELDSFLTSDITWKMNWATTQFKQLRIEVLEDSARLHQVITTNLILTVARLWLVLSSKFHPRLAKGERWPTIISSASTVCRRRIMTLKKLKSIIQVKWSSIESLLITKLKKKTLPEKSLKTS